MAVALPEAVAQGEVRDLVVDLYPHLAGSRYLSVFDNAGIERRPLVRPLDWYRRPHDLAERSALAVDEGTRLGAEAGRRALDAAGVDGREVDALVVVSTTVLRSPGIDVDLTAQLGLREDVRRLQLFGLASLGGAAGLALAADLVRAGHRHVLVVAAEVNSGTFVPGDDSVGALVTLALFSDGAAGVVVSADRGSVAVAGRHTTLVPGTLDVMGFDVDDPGLHWHLAAAVPDVVRDHTAASVDDAVAATGWARSDLDHVLVHPGGIRLLEVCREVLGLAPGALDRSYAALADHGNLSSATVLAVLGRWLGEGEPTGRALLVAMGPGFAYEHVLLEGRPQG